MIELKCCTTCKISKHLDEFSVQKSGKGGRHASCKACKRAYSLEQYRKCNPRERSLWKYHRMTLQEFKALESSQDGCAVCSKQVKLVVDHDHSTNEIRGLLCSNCNTGLGMFKDSTELLEKASNYLRNSGRGD